jgi:hypothetical protein
VLVRDSIRLPKSRFKPKYLRFQLTFSNKHSGLSVHAECPGVLSAA